MGSSLLSASALLVVSGVATLAQESTSTRPPPRQPALLPPPTPPPRPTPNQITRIFREPDESSLWLQSTDGQWTSSDRVQYELDRRKNPSFTGANDPFGDHGWQGSCNEDSTCLKQCASHDEKCSVVARGCRSCLLADYDETAGKFNWKYRTYASTLNEYWAEPCFTCGEWEGVMADPERVIMDAPAVYGVATVAISSKHWSPLATDAATDEGRRFVSAFRSGVAAWVESIANDPDREFLLGTFAVPADTVMVEYLHPRDSAEVQCAGSTECATAEMQRDGHVQFAMVQWWIVVGGGRQQSNMEVNMPKVIEVGCDDTTFPDYDVLGLRATPPVMIDFDTQARGNLGFKLLNCMVDPSVGTTGKSVRTGVLRLGSVIGEVYEEPAAKTNWMLDGFVLMLVVILCWCGKKKHNDHMAKWKDIQDGRSIYASDPQAKVFMQDDWDKFRAVTQGEKRQAAKYTDGREPQTDERLFASVDALLELLQRLIDEGAGQTPREGLRAACHARIDPELLNGVLSLLDRYKLEKPRARSQKKLEQSIGRSESRQGLQHPLTDQAQASNTGNPLSTNEV